MRGAARRTNPIPAAIGVLVGLLGLVSCTGSPPAPPESSPPLPIPTIEGVHPLDCSATVAVGSSGDAAADMLEVSGVVFTSVSAAGRSRVHPAAGAVPVKNAEAYRYFAKTPIVLPDASWATIEIAPGATTAWVAWVPGSVWTGDGWTVDDYVNRAMIIDLDHCGSAYGERMLLGGLVLAEPGCVDVVVRTSAVPEGETRTINLSDGEC